MRVNSECRFEGLCLVSIKSMKYSEALVIVVIFGGGQLMVRLREVIMASLMVMGVCLIVMSGHCRKQPCNITAIMRVHFM